MQKRKLNNLMKQFRLIFVLLFLGCMAALASGCGSREMSIETFKETGESAEMDSEKASDRKSVTDSGDLSKDPNDRSDGESHGTPDDGADIDPDDEAVKAQDDSGTKSDEKPETVYVYVCGAVMNEGVYELPGDSRIKDALEMSGGYSEDAYRGYVNLAEGLYDGERIYFPTVQEVNDGAPAGVSGENGNAGGKGTDVSSESGATGSGGYSSDERSKVNINSAGKEELMTLPGIGESKAEDILSYRETEGGFGSIEDIQNVSGIGAATFSRLKDRIDIR